MTGVVLTPEQQQYAQQYQQYLDQQVRMTQLLILTVIALEYLNCFLFVSLVQLMPLIRSLRSQHMRPL